MTATSSTAVPGLDFSECQYGDHHLQRIGVWSWSSSSHPASNQTQPGYWLIYLHGGAWRDPSRTYNDFLPTIRAVMASADPQTSRIRGFAGIDYRLSPHPGFPQDADATPATELRAAKHPDHIHDVSTALAHMNREHGIGQDYVLIGHSAGATLACQLLTTPAESSAQAPLPRAIVGLSGIYDLCGLVARMDQRGIDVYRTFATSAFGTDDKTWAAASPALHPAPLGWEGGSLACLAWSQDDTLVDEPEIDAMALKLGNDGTPCRIVKTLTGEHDTIWGTGHQVAELAIQTLRTLRSGE